MKTGETIDVPISKLTSTKNNYYQMFSERLQGGLKLKFSVDHEKMVGTVTCITPYSV